VSETVRTIGYLWFGGERHYAIRLLSSHSMTKWPNNALHRTAATLVRSGDTGDSHPCFAIHHSGRRQSVSLSRYVSDA
jgi:hypothetical protein